MSTARHLTVLMKVGLSVACLGMVALWPEWRISLQAQDYCTGECGDDSCPPTPDGSPSFCYIAETCTPAPGGGFTLPCECGPACPNIAEDIDDSCALPCSDDEVCFDNQCVPVGDSDDADLGGDTADTNTSSGQEGQTSGDPINNTTGTLLQIETDYVGAGPFPLVLRRTYNSQPPLAEALPGPFGANWSHSYSAHILIVSETSVQVVRADGKTLTFDLQPDGLWRSSPDVHSGTELVVDASDNLSGWRYTTGSDDVETYNATGKLLSITTRAGLTQTLEYDGQERLATVTDPFGRILVFAYNEGNRISSVTDPAGARTATNMIAMTI